MLNKKLIAVIIVVVLIATVSVFEVLNMQQEAAKQRVEAAYFGMNQVPPGLEANFPSDTIPAGGHVNYYYSWNITVYNLNPLVGWGDTIKNFLKSEMQTYPQLATYTLFGDTYVIGGAANFNDKGTKICQAIYTT